MCVLTETNSPKGGSSRRAAGPEGGFHSVSAIRPPFGRAASNVERLSLPAGERRCFAVLERRMARREVEVGILEELAEQRLLKSDFEGFRHVARKAWSIKVRNIRLGIWMMRHAMEGGAA